MFESTTQSQIFDKLPWFLPAATNPLLKNVDEKEVTTLEPTFVKKNNSIKHFKNRNKKDSTDKIDNNINAENIIRNWRKKMYKLFKSTLQSNLKKGKICSKFFNFFFSNLKMLFLFIF